MVVAAIGTSWCCDFASTRVMRHQRLLSRLAVEFFLFRSVPVRELHCGKREIFHSQGLRTEFWFRLSFAVGVARLTGGRKLD